MPPPFIRACFRDNFRRKFFKDLGAGMSKGRDSPAIFCLGPDCPAGQLCGTVSRKFVPVPLVPQTSFPVPVPRDTKSAGTDRDSRSHLKEYPLAVKRFYKVL